MSLERHSLHFRQLYDGGYRYLDKCGEFLLIAESKFGLYPVDINPNSCILEDPERSIKVSLNTTELKVVQEFPENNINEFPEICASLAEIYKSIFKPREIERDGFATNNYYPFANYEKAQEESLKFWNGFEQTLSKTIGMVLVYKNLEYSYKSGNKEFLIKLRPGTFENITLLHKNPSPRAPTKKLENIRRHNIATEKVSSLKLASGLFLEFDLMEFYPPERNLLDLFNELIEKESDIKENFMEKK